MKEHSRRQQKKEHPCVIRDVLSSSGQPLDSATHVFMEQRFGHDFGQVRVHTDDRAAESAKDVNALAYTAGSDVVFGAGQYAPGTTEGQRLIAHELTHVVQQNGRHPDFQGDLTISQSGDTAEIEAKAISGQVIAGQPVQVQIAQGAAIARTPEEDEQDVDPAAVMSSADAPTSFPGDITAEAVEPPPTTTNDVTEAVVENKVDMGQGGASGNANSDLAGTDGVAGTAGVELSSEGGAGGAGGVEVRPVDGGGGAGGAGGAELSSDSSGGAGGAGGVEVRPVDGGGGAHGASGSSESQQEGNGGVPEWLHTTLDVAGLIPGVGEFADLANAGLYAAEGRNEEALLSAAAAIPFLGTEVTVSKLAAKGAKEIAEAGVKKGVKEIAEAGVKKEVKEIAETGVKKEVKEIAEEGASKEVKEIAEEGASKEIKEITETGGEQIERPDLGKKGTRRNPDGSPQRPDDHQEQIRKKAVEIERRRRQAEQAGEEIEKDMGTPDLRKLKKGEQKLKERLRRDKYDPDDWKN